MNYFRMGRVAGIDIHVNWSWCFIFGLVSWSLSLTFAQIHPEWSSLLRWGVAMLAAFLFFLCVLAHELAHSLVALARGVPVANITLFMLGGVSNMQREPATPAEEMVITIVGPLTSLFTGRSACWPGREGWLGDCFCRLQPPSTRRATRGAFRDWPRRRRMRPLLVMTKGLVGL